MKKCNIIEVLNSEIGTRFKAKDKNEEYVFRVCEDTKQKVIFFEKERTLVAVTDWICNLEFEKIEENEIDWTKVPRGTKVQVRDSENQEWSNAYFSKILKSKNTDYPFRASSINDDEFTKLNLDDTSWSYKCCRIHKSVEIPEEWYKEEINE